MTHEQLIINQRKNLLIYADRHGVSKACQIFGVSRTTFYKLKEQFLKTGSLAPKIKGKPRMPNETKLNRKKMLLSMIKEFPMESPLRYSYRFREQGIHFCSSSIWYILHKWGLSKKYQRLIYLEQLHLKGQPLTERSLKEIKYECKKAKKGLWPGHIVAIDTFYAGNLKGIGRIYQLTGIDLCSRFGLARLYTAKDQTASIDFVENTLIPAFYQNKTDINSILSDNGSEFIGSKFQAMLRDYEIQHLRIEPGTPMCNGCCERFQRTIYEEFYQTIFRKKFFTSLDELQNELNKYLAYYNFQRVHFGAVKSGAKPIDVLLAKQSVLQHRFQLLST
jgi:transposase InsO family protein